MDAIKFYKYTPPVPRPYDNIQFRPPCLGALPVSKARRVISAGAQPTLPVNGSQISTSEKVPTPLPQHHSEDASSQPPEFPSVDPSEESPAKAPGTFAFGVVVIHAADHEKKTQ